ncbi:ParA family protein [Tsuneonella flava]|uniref:ParA family protein n=1 Tax=Tsuneonella flava TaxID=2055955 RepID=A0ABX7KE63_9SPHN|nr:ParA family protein [Tsuneonella flava]QSB45551.1 ParA family protein [Tsuneonella flava]
MAVIAVYSVKGGVGKTTLATNLAWCSATISCRKTLLWDLDAAGGAGYLLGIDPKAKRRADTVIAADKDPVKLIRHTAIANLDLLPADESIRALEVQLLSIGKRKRIAKLAAQLSKLYDRIVIDCPPILGETSAQVMRAADLVIVPLPPSPLSSRAFELVAKEVAAHARPHPPILPVLSMLDLRRTLHKDVRATHPGWPAIPYASAAEQCAVRRQPVGAFAPTAPVTRSYAALWTAIERKLASK